MTENLMPPPMLDALKPEYVTPGVVYLASRDAPNGTVLTAGAGVFAVARIFETDGVFIPPAELSVEAVAAAWSRIEDSSKQEAYPNGGGQTQKFFRKMQGG
jgi:predicted ATP-grasp superfamily ATP-dependent carboligase